MEWKKEPDLEVGGMGRINCVWNRGEAPIGEYGDMDVKRRKIWTGH